MTAGAVAARAGERVLGLAAGAGTSSEAFTAAGADCAAGDFSLGMLQAGVRRPQARTRFRRDPAPGRAMALFRYSITYLTPLSVCAGVDAVVGW